MNSKIIENVKSNIKKGMELFDKEAIKRGIEIWKTIEGYPNFDVSSFGNIKNTETGIVLNPRNNSSGYNFVNLLHVGMGKNISVHRLVALAFIPNPNNKPCVDHIDNIRINNNVNNLRWATYSENSQNQKLNCNSKSGIKGVSWNKKYNKWFAQIYSNSENIRIGYYNTIEEAKKARQKKAKELFGEFINACEQ